MANFTFQVGNLISDDQYWDAPRDDGSLVRALCYDGNFAIFWKFSPDDPGFPIFDVKVHSPGRHFATLEDEGFSLYEGSPVKPGKVVWRAPCPNADHGVLQDNGQLSLYDTSGKLRWQSAQNLTSDGVRTIHSWVTDPMLWLSSLPSTGDPDNYVSVQPLRDRDPNLEWEMVNLHADGQTFGTLRSRATGRLLYIEPVKGWPARQSSAIGPNSLWYFFHIGDGDAQYGLRTINCGRLMLNEAGDRPKAGGRAILWDEPQSGIPTNSRWGVDKH